MLCLKMLYGYQVLIQLVCRNNGSVRVYGTWTGKSNETGKSFAVDSYHFFDVQDGKIISSGDYFDATGMVMAIAATTEEE